MGTTKTGSNISTGTTKKLAATALPLLRLAVKLSVTELLLQKLAETKLSLL